MFNFILRFVYSACNILPETKNQQQHHYFRWPKAIKRGDIVNTNANANNAKKISMDANGK